MNPLNICLSLPSTIASRDKNSHSFQQRPYWFRCHGIWLFSARAAAEQSILSRSYTFIFFPVSLQQLCSRGFSHPTMELSTAKVQINPLHTLLCKRVNAKTQPRVGSGLQAFISQWGNTRTLHYPVRTPKNVGASWSWTTWLYRNHPPHHSNAPGSAEKQSQKTYYWRPCRCESLQAWSLAATVKN